MSKQQKTNKKAKNKARNIKLLKLLLGEVLVLLLLIIGYGVFYINSKANKIVVDDIPKEDIEVNDIQSENIDKYKTIAIFGGDARTVGTYGKGTHSDVIIIASINNETKEVELVSVYRDTYLEIAKPEPEYLKANAAFFLGGGPVAINTLNRNLDLSIDDYIIVDWKAVTNGINLLGGVDVHIESNELEILNLALLEQQEVTGIKSAGVYDTGMVHLNGSQATAYARIRSTGMGDITRTERQREVIASMVAQAKSSDLKTLNKVMDEMFLQIGTSITKADMFSLASAIFSYKLGDTCGFPYAYVPSDIKGSVLVPADLESNVVLLHEFLFEDENYVPSATVKRISAEISSQTGVGNNVTGEELNNIVNTQIEKHN